MESVRVFSQNELEQIVENDEPIHTHLISIGNPGKKRGRSDHNIPEEFTKKYKSILRLEFWDVEKRSQVRNRGPKRAPKKTDVRNILRYYRNSSRASGFDVHCWRGISRSTAVALILLYLELQDEKAASDKLVSIRRNAMPNKALVGFFDEIMHTSLGQFQKTIFRSRIEAMRRSLEPGK